MPASATTHIVIDFGNTLKKIAVFHDEELASLQTFRSKEFRRVERYLLSLPRGSSCIISSVIDYPPHFSATLKGCFNTVFLTHETPIPLRISYATPQTLGKDRIAAAVAAWHMFPHKNLLVIDAGTAITLDFVSQHGEYLGGSISPGIDLRFKALHYFTGHLPLILRKNIRFLTGSSTQESILSGVINGTVAEIDGTIDQYRRLHPDLITILGGGDAKFLHKRLKNSIFALPNLTLSGLNIILRYNIENAHQH
ncbi:MAG: type III pantothenate kinase [Bacteroidales bacterium]|nr:type III pantothenate kinase [Bacteroidales bacterium]